VYYGYIVNRDHPCFSGYSKTLRPHLQKKCPQIIICESKKEREGCAFERATQDQTKSIMLLRDKIYVGERCFEISKCAAKLDDPIPNINIIMKLFMGK
jgi:hypothetical protein